jgi:hypothetical protein
MDETERTRRARLRDALAILGGITSLVRLLLDLIER